MKPVIGCDAHKHYSVFIELKEDGKASAPVRIEHHRQRLREYLESLASSADIAIESTGHWYWLVDEIEQAGHRPHLAEPLEAKKRMGKTHKTDALDAKGLAILLRNGTLPEVWIPPAEIRDQRELLRTRMAVRDVRTMLKHRIHSALERYGVFSPGISDLFGAAGREALAAAVTGLPAYTAEMVNQQLASFDLLGEHLTSIEIRIEEVIQPNPAVKRLRTMPGVGKVLGPVIALELGDVHRFASAERLASDCGLVRACFLRVAIRAWAEHRALSICISNGPLWKPPTVRFACAAPNTGMCANCSSVCSRAKDTAARLLPSRGTWRRRRSGC